MRRTRKNQIDLEIFRKTATWAEQIVAKFPEFQDYAGCGEFGEDLSNVHLALKLFGKDPTLSTMLKLRLEFLRQKARANFAGTLANQITMLAFLKGAGKTRGIHLTKLEKAVFNK
jgi:hypothetical protein